MKKTINYLLALGLLLSSIQLKAQWNWVTKSNSTNVEYGWDVSADASGNSYITGAYFGSAVFGSTTLTNSGQDDAYLTKINASGTIQWAVKAGGTLYDHGLRVVTNGTDVYMAGTFRGNITFFSTNATTTSLAGSNFNDECFIAKYNSSGVVQWATAISGANSQRPFDIELNNALSRVYITGEDNNKTFINCYNFSSGTLVWSKVNNGTTNGAIGYGIAVDAVGSCYSIARFNIGNYDMAGSPSYSVSTTSDLIMMKLDASGNFSWGQQMGIAATVEQPRDIDIDASGNLYVSGQYQSGSLSIAPFTLTNSGNIDLFVAKFPNTGGNASWVKKIGGTWTEYPTGQCIDAASGNVYISVKNTNGNTATIPSTCFTFTAAIGGTDQKSYLVKYKTNGDVDWAVAPNLGNDQSQFNGLSIDANKHIYVSGNLAGTGTFGSISLTGASSDAMLAKINLEPNFGTYQICQGNTATITATGVTGLTFKWYPTNIATVPLFTGISYTTPALSTTTTYYVSIVLGGCESSRIPVTVTVLPYAIVNAGPDQTICAGNCANINFTSSTGGVWLTNNSTSITTGPFYSSPITVCPTTTTTYTLKNTLDPSYCKNSDLVTITVNPSPVISADFALTGSIPIGSTLYYIVTANVLAVPAGSGFFWEISEIDNLGNVVPSTTITNPSNWWNPSLYFTNPFPGYDVPNTSFVNTIVGNGKFYLGHKYRITRGTWGPCTPYTTVSKEIYLCSGCKMANGQPGFIVENSSYAPSKEEIMNKSKTRTIDLASTSNVFPNPNNGAFTITSSNLETTLKITVRDLLGKVVLTETKSINDGKVQMQLNCNNGTYLVEVKDLNTNGISIRKIVIQK
jgi:hypothetical protein